MVATKPSSTNTEGGQKNLKIDVFTCATGLD